MNRRFARTASGSGARSQGLTTPSETPLFARGDACNQKSTPPLFLSESEFSVCRALVLWRTEHPASKELLPNAEFTSDHVGFFFAQDFRPILPASYSCVHKREHHFCGGFFVSVSLFQFWAVGASFAVLIKGPFHFGACRSAPSIGLDGPIDATLSDAMSLAGRKLSTSDSNILSL